MKYQLDPLAQGLLFVAKQRSHLKISYRDANRMGGYQVKGLTHIWLSDRPPDRISVVVTEEAPLEFRLDYHVNNRNHWEQHGLWECLKELFPDYFDKNKFGSWSDVHAVAGVIDSLPTLGKIVTRSTELLELANAESVKRLHRS